MSDAESTPTTEDTQPVMETLLTPEKSTESGNDVFTVDNYDQAGNFDFRKLEVEIIPSGFRCFDKNKLLKKGRGQLIVIAAYTSHGKTAMMMQLAAHVAQEGPVFVHSFEMSREQLETRLVATVLGVPAEHIMGGKLSKSMIEKANEEFRRRRLFLCKTNDNTAAYIQTSCYEKAKQVGRPLMIVVDYLQIMGGGRERASRTNEIADYMRELKTLAQQLECPVVLGSQMNRECELRGKKIEARHGEGEYRPITSDLADSSSIAMDADAVVFITRQEQYDGKRPGRADILCAKNRDGSIFEEELHWRGETCSFLDVVSKGKVGL